MEIGPILNKIQLFKNLLENLLRSVWIGGLPACMSRNFSVNFEVFERQYLLQYGPDHTKLEDFANLGFLFQTLWVVCCLPDNKRTHTQPPSA